MDFDKFLGRLDESTVKSMLKEWKGSEAVDSWAALPEDVKAALQAEGLSKATWAYIPKGRDLVVVEEGPNNWSLFSLKSTLNNSRKRNYSGSRLNEASPMNFDVDELDAETRSSLKTASNQSNQGNHIGSRTGIVSSEGVKAVQIKSGEFADILKECVAIVKEDAYLE